MTNANTVIITIGTEVTAGEIVNTNAAWLSTKLTDLHLPVVLHTSVPDDEDAILDALKIGADHGRFLIITGGLGPTSDDKTRAVVAKWLGKSLVYHHLSWQKIEERIQSLGLRVAAVNKVQCYFPEGCEILSNEHGTADAFAFEHQGITGICLPGPPHEIKHLWDKYLAKRFAAVASAKPTHLLKWHTMGKSEADINELVEALVINTPLQTGYRSHFPLITTKIWCPKELLPAYLEKIAAIETALNPWLVAKDEEDLAKNFLRAAATWGELLIIDQVCHGLLAERLQPLMRQDFSPGLTLSHVVTSKPVPLPSNKNYLVVAEHPKEGWQLTLHHKGLTATRLLTYPYKAKTTTRVCLYLAERALYEGRQLADELNDA